jgi:hypothetical protein
METRRIRRLERRRLRRIVALCLSIAVIGVAVGMTLPQSTTASVVLLGAAVGCLVVLVVRGDAMAPLHGLRRVVRLPLRRSISATMESVWRRVVGSLRAWARLRPHPTPLLLDEPDDESPEWWGITPMAPPGVSSAAPDAEATTPEAPPAPLPAPVLAAPMRSARVLGEDGGLLRRGLEHLRAGVRRPSEAIGGRRQDPAGGAGAPS